MRLVVITMDNRDTKARDARLRERAKTMRYFEDQDRYGDGLRSQSKIQDDCGGGGVDTKVRMNSLDYRNQEREQQLWTLRLFGVPVIW